MNVSKLKIAELKKALKERGLATTGNKSELAARLREALSAEGSDTSLQDEDIEAKESELLGEEEDEEDGTEAAELDTKLLDTNPPAMKPKKIIINREAAASAQQAAEEAIAQQEAEKAAPPPTAAADAQPPKKRIRITNSTEMDKDGASHDNIKILTPEERKAARLAKFGTATDTPVTKEITAAGDASSKKVPIKAAVDLDVLKKRADRFGEVVSNKVKTLEEKERLQKRKERFGIVSPEEAKTKRGERFSVGSGKTSITAPANSDPAAEEKKRSRALRFGST